MAQGRLNNWRTLFARALQIVDSVAASGQRFDDWSFGGGTVLMRRFRHRVSRDVDIFVPDPQYLGYVSPRLNDTVEELASSHLETATAVKLYFPEGEIDFIVSPPLTKKPTTVETVLGDRQHGKPIAALVEVSLFDRLRKLDAEFEQVSSSLSKAFAGAGAAKGAALVDEAVKAARRKPAPK